MKRITENILILLIGIGSLILPLLDRIFFSVVSEHSSFESILAVIVFIVSSFIAIVFPPLIKNPKAFKSNCIKFIAAIPLIFTLPMFIPSEWINPRLENVLDPIFQIFIFEIVFFPILLVIDVLYFLAPFLFLLLIFLSSYLLSEYIQKSKNKFLNIFYLILYIYVNLVITMGIWLIIYFE